MMRLRNGDRRGKRRLAALLAATAAVAALGLLQRAQAIVGGAAPVAAEFGRFVVMILGSSGTACTATAIGRDLLLTAAHCVLPGADYKLLGSEVRAAARSQDHQSDRSPSPIRHQAAIQPSRHRRRCRDQTCRAAPPRIAPALLAGGNEAVAVGDSLVVVGYGVTVRGDGRSGGTARAATLVVTGQPGSLQIRLFDPEGKGLSPGLGACAGDSGAPVFRTSGATPEVVGVVSWSTGPNLTTGCGGLTGITPLARYRSWIIDTARTLGTALAP